LRIGFKLVLMQAAGLLPDRTRPMYGMPQPERHDWQPCVCADEALQFIHQHTAGWSGNVSVMALASDGSTKTKTVPVDRIDELGPFIESRNGTSNLYFGVNPLAASRDKKATKKGIAALAYLHADLDPRDGFDLGEERKRLKKLIDEFPITPNLIIDSGGGFQAFWRLREPVLANGNIERVERYNQRIAALLGADHCSNIDRLMRLPGTVNLPDARKRAKGREPAFAQVVYSDDGTFALEDFDALLGGTKGAQAHAGEHGEHPEISVDDLRVSIELKQLIREGGPKGCRSNALFAVLRAMVKTGHTDDEMAAVLVDPANALSEKPREKGPAWLLGEIRRAREKPDRGEEADAKQGDDSADSSSQSPGDGQAQVNPLDALNRFIVTEDQVNAMNETQMIWLWLIAQSHLIVWAAPSGFGKTTLAKLAAAQLAALGFKVLFFQEDASAGDLPALHQHAKEHGYHLLNSTLAGSSQDEVLKVLNGIVRSGEPLDDYVFIFDTLKKFTDLMSKGGARTFFKLMRGLTQRGATVLLLGHTNKYKGADGKWIFEGVHEVRTDVDELFYIDATPKDAQGMVTLTITPDKMRCAVRETTFELDTLSMTVRALDKPIDVAAQNEAKRQMEADQPVIACISLLLKDGGMQYTALVNKAYETGKALESGLSRSTVKRVLDQYLSKNPKDPNAKWIETKLRQNNTRLITLKADAEGGAV
jgi:hypothetical protein